MTSKNALAYIAVAATATAAGVFVGMLIAPASGEDTRRALARRLEEKQDALRKRVRKAVDHVACLAEDGIEAGKDKLDALLEH